ncbi:MAG: L-seryl-tRNA(Sec) selenium transferase [Candidatus Hydrogenedentes bacterium]|nr:L-seryl-tRNA(Sec) selenium transferase [Candidatus Hydrogenedentota bacterium]
MNDTNAPNDPRTRLPSVSKLLDTPECQSYVARYSRPIVLDAVRSVLDGYRNTLDKIEAVPGVEVVLEQTRLRLEEDSLDRLRPVVNATGIILHTGLGRAVLPRQAAQALGQQDRCCNIQIDLASGLRGKRNYECQRLLCALTGAEDALLVNNNAAATLLILASLCAGKDVIVSRGQLIEIGGSYRLPDCVHQSGAHLVEVGTTNKTHLRDYEAALTEETGAILRVNPSNYRIVGFSKEVSIGELVSLKEKTPALVIDDLGCGALVDLTQFGLPHEPTVQESVAAGADLVCFSGDKLIGGPQCGIIVGKKALVQRIRKHPLTRMLRVCKLTDVALEHTLRLFLTPETLVANNPTLRMLAAPVNELKSAAVLLKEQLDAAGTSFTVSVEAGESAMGGGSLPATPIPTCLLTVRDGGMSAERLSALLRRNEPPIIARIADDKVVFDMRTLLEGEAAIVLEALKRLSA